MRFFVLIALIMTTGTLHADWKTNATNSCWVDSAGLFEDKFWYCGYHNESDKKATKCGGTWLNFNDERIFLYHGESFEYDPWYKTGSGGKYWCCTGTKTTAGYFVKNGSWIIKKGTVTVELENGTCTYEKTVNACGEETSTPCTEPTTCAKGYIDRNNECIQPCEDGQVFESPTSNKCIPCETTMYQGVKNDTDGQYCLKCDQHTEFFDKKKKQCVNKDNGYKKISKDIMKQCGLCPNSTIFKGCIECLSSDNYATCAETYKTDCFLKLETSNQ